MITKALVLTAIAAIAALSATAVTAQAPTTQYVAVPVEPTTKQTHIIASVFWHARGNVWSAPIVGSRPETVCANLARRLGKLDSFSVAGKAFDVARMEACNASAPRDS